MLLWLSFAIAMLVLMTMGLHSVGSYLKSALLYLLSAIVASVDLA